jgi:hypothetical protein
MSNLKAFNVNLHRLANSHGLHLFLTVLGGFLSFWGAYQEGLASGELPSTLDAGTILSENLLYGSLYHGSSLVALTLAVPLYLDVLFDLYDVHISPWFKRRQSKPKKETSDTPTPTPTHKPRPNDGRQDPSDNHLNILTPVERFLLITGIILGPIVAFIPPSRIDNIGLLYWCAVRAQTHLVAGAVVTSLTRFDKLFFPGRTTVLFLVLLAIGNALSPVATNQSLDRNTFTNIAALVFTWVPAASFLYLILRWLVVVPFELNRLTTGEELVHRILSRISEVISPPLASHSSGSGTPRTPRSDPGTTFNPIQSNAQLSFRSIYVVTIIVWLCLRLASSLLYSHASDYDDVGLFFTNLPFILFEMSTLVFGLRYVKHEVVQGLVQLIEAKKNYVRYIR